MSKLLKDIIKCDFCELETNNILSFKCHTKSCNIVENNIDEIISEYSSGISIKKLINKYKVSYKLMSRVFNKLDIKIRNNRESMIGRVGTAHTEESKKRISIARKEFLSKNPDKHPWKLSSKFISKPCENFKKVINNIGIFYIEEMNVSNERNFSIDIAFPQYKIGIEINGNQHYNNDGTLKEYYKDRNIYITKLGWKLYEIHYSVCFDNNIILKIFKNILSGVETIYDFDYEEYLINKLKLKDVKICSCGNKIKRLSKKCVKCASIDSSLKRRKVERPTYIELLKIVYEIGYSATGRKYGVSDVSIRKWLKYYEKYEKKEIL